MKNIEFKIGIRPKTSEIIKLYDSSGIIRPTNDSERITKMYKNSNLIISAWIDNQLVGIARSITDFCFACYLSDLAVHNDYQKEGIGRHLINLTQKEIGPQTTLILISAPLAMEYYPKIGFDPIKNGFVILRTE